MLKPIPVDVVIFGGGVAGLWLLARLRKLGYQAVLLEQQAIGAGQTRYAQGIIHGGTKYALSGQLTGSAEAIAEMPAIWRACLAGEGELDLRQVKLLSPHQYLWSSDGLGSRMASFLASKLMRARTRSVATGERPEVLRNPAFKGQVYQLDEPVLDTASLLKALATPHLDAILQLPDGTSPRIERGSDDHNWQITLNHSEHPPTLQTKRIVLCAGKGNAALLQQLGMAQPAMQTRPLNMVLLRAGPGKRLPGELYAHCLGTSAIPRITITTHQDAQGNSLWYLGGQLAEQGVGRSDAEQIAAAQVELTRLFPWLDLSDAQWACAQIDRAEPKTPQGERPDTSYVHQQQGVITAWPTKLALAPRLAQQVIEQLVQGGVHAAPSSPVPPELSSWPHPGFARLPWQEDAVWN
ncbi:MAG: FAD-dependent oxidoreductase [Gammaproteobacteria bacterium]|nr:FAD-dependent oxidoreductase [Gammaproteobacteria bacterium]